MRCSSLHFSVQAAYNLALTPGGCVASVEPHSVLKILPVFYTITWRQDKAYLCVVSENLWHFAL